MTSSSSDISSSAARGTPLKFARIEPEWQGQIAICIGSGPSLCEDDLKQLMWYPGMRCIVVNDAVRVAGWADVVYAPDGQWWKTAPTTVMGTLRRFSLDPTAPPHVELLNFRTGTGVSLDPTIVMTGGHGGFQAINVAAHYRPRRIVLLGYDMQPGADGRHHFFGDHADGSHVNYEYKIGAYASLAKPLADLGIEIVNASRVSAIPANYIPRVSLADALAD